MKQFIQTFDELPRILRIIFCLPAIDIIYVVYRIVKSCSKNNTLGVVLGIILLVLGLPWLWLLDLITVVVYDKVLWID